MRRAEALARLRAQVDAGRPIIGAGAGTGLSAKCAEAGGADLIIIYNSGRYRMAGRGSLSGLLPYGDANAIVVEMSREVLPIVRDTPVLAGVCGTDPFRLIPVFLEEIERIGFSGVQNFPTVGLFDGMFRQNLEETGMGYGLEVEMIRAARERDLLTAPYVFSVEEAAAMAEAGADVLVPHMGLTTGGAIGAGTAKTLDECVPADPGDARRRNGGQPGNPRPLPRRADLRAGRRGVHPRADRRRRRVLRRILDGAAAYRDGDHREHAPLQGDCDRKGEGMSAFVRQSAIRNEDFGWGVIGWRCTPGGTGAKQLVVLDVSLEPAQSHDFHRHPGQEEMIIVKSGNVEQWLEQEAATLGPGDSVFIGADLVHATFNDGDEPAHLQVVLGPALDSEIGYGLVDVSGEAPWSSLRSGR